MQLLELIGHHGLGWLGYTNPDVPVVKPRYTFSRQSLLSSGNSHTMFNELLDEYIAHGCGVSGNTMKIMLPTTPGIPVPDVIVKYAMLNERHSQRNIVREFEVLQAAKQQGIACANANLSSCERLLLIERFDIQANGKRMGLESFGGLLGVNANQHASYELAAQMIELFSSNPKRCLERFFEQLVTHLLSGCLASLSKFSLLYDDKGKVELAPLYGVNSPQDTKKRVSWPLRAAVPLYRKNSERAIQSMVELERFGRFVCRADPQALVKAHNSYLV
jgi:serine/threonine-protein kinase HipA